MKDESIVLRGLAEAARKSWSLDPMPGDHLRECVAEAKHALDRMVADARLLPCVENCREERAAGNGGCGACALCCKEARDVADEWRAALAQDEAAHRTAINDLRDDRDHFRDELVRAEAMAMDLANVLDAEHRRTHPLECECPTGKLLTRAREWAR